MRYVSRLDENGAAIKVQDPLAERFASIALASKGDARELATSLFAIKSIFGDEFIHSYLSNLLGRAYNYHVCSPTRLALGF